MASYNRNADVRMQPRLAQRHAQRPSRGTRMSGGPKPHSMIAQSTRTCHKHEWGHDIYLAFELNGCEVGIVIIEAWATASKGCCKRSFSATLTANRNTLRALL
ncbi:hypothetical protein EGR_10127 [Echinococcus granulosus]|uniref:Uncharacterized protein n=1 Tax=Echinococcus granulosus TaxID=6210 RepID=W6UNS2_ECHGR|nr:hypothetical protein EGR_10127 [Echinococcus granulosus]EUB55009.1 hypothetical protein EGR_10127 [Echinococcus granulosus]